MHSFFLIQRVFQMLANNYCWMVGFPFSTFLYFLNILRKKVIWKERNGELHEKRKDNQVDLNTNKMNIFLTYYFYSLKMHFLWSTLQGTAERYSTKHKRQSPFHLGAHILTIQRYKNKHMLGNDGYHKAKWSRIEGKLLNWWDTLN